MLQRAAFTTDELAELADGLDSANGLAARPWQLGPTHRTPLIGNVDVDVIVVALQTHGLHCVWFNAKKDINTVRFDRVHGIVVNRSSVLPWTKHWFAIRRIDGVFYDLDSRKSQPVPFESTKALVGRLVELQRTRGAHVLLVTTEPYSLDELLTDTERAVPSGGNS